ncbi:glycosyltransferase [Rhodocista pekingensis]|uniref:Glycosyltransferase n=1 Tax=Rhodocista pekingensis TaxID=201185 RepID=A0ABW2L0R5_9PROT
MTALAEIASAPDRAAPIRLLTFSSLYPNREQPGFGVFVENRLRQLCATGEVQATVVAPVPWFPLASPRFGRYGALARVPAREFRHGIEVLHPRFPALPKVGTALSPGLMAAALLPFLRGLIRQGRHFDLIDAHYFYPDGVAAVLLGRALGLPVTVTARGTDINHFPTLALPRRLIRRAAERADGLIAVAGPLRDRLRDLAPAAPDPLVLRNGVDLRQFSPSDRAAARRALGLSGPLLLSAGNLVAGKGHDRVIRALTDLPGVTLAIAGKGPEEDRLRRLAAELGLAERVRLLGALPHAAMPGAYNAADALVLASASEGCANVLLEAMACGTPVIASDVGGASELVITPAAGSLLPDRTPAAIAAAARALLAAPPPRAATRAHAERFGWEATTAGQLALFRRILAGRVPDRAEAGQKNSSSRQ